MKEFWKKYKLLILILLFAVIGINGLKNIPEHFFYSQEEFFNNAVSESYNESYDGIVKRKFYLKEGGRDVIILNKNGITRQFDFVYENPNLYEFIKVGDTLIKKSGTNSIIIRRSELDTIINLKFENLKGAELHSDNNKYLNN